jgi:hypothetical protein
MPPSSAKPATSSPRSKTRNHPGHQERDLLQPSLGSGGGVDALSAQFLTSSNKPKSDPRGFNHIIGLEVMAGDAVSACLRRPTGTFSVKWEQLSVLPRGRTHVNVRGEQSASGWRTGERHAVLELGPPAGSLVNFRMLPSGPRRCRRSRCCIDKPPSCCPRPGCGSRR